MQLRHERTEERRKLFKIAEKRQNVAETPLARWKKILPALPQAKEMLRNSEATQRDDVQITIGNLNDSMERKQLTADIEQDLLLYDKNRNGEEDDSRINDTTSKRYIFTIKIYNIYLFQVRHVLLVHSLRQINSENYMIN